MRAIINVELHYNGSVCYINKHYKVLSIHYIVNMIHETSKISRYKQAKLIYNTQYITFHQFAFSDARSEQNIQTCSLVL